LIRYLLVVIGGGTGALARYVAASAIMTRFGGKFPLGTLVINVTGSFLIGFLMTMLTERFKLDPNWRLLLVVGFLGGYTGTPPFRALNGRRTHRSGTAGSGLGCSTSFRALCLGT
jgi:protein CrcB